MGFGTSRRDMAGPCPLQIVFLHLWHEYSGKSKSNIDSKLYNDHNTENSMCNTDIELYVFPRLRTSI